MSDFFGPPPPPPPEQPAHRAPAWTGPPDNELGIAVPVWVELVRTDSLALAILRLVAFSTGFSFAFAIRRRVATPQQILEAAAQVEELWPDDDARPSGGNAWTTTNFVKE